MRDVAWSAGRARLFAFPCRQAFVIRAEPMPEAKVDGSHQVDRENETKPPATGCDLPAGLDQLLCNVVELLEQIEAKSSFHADDDPSCPAIAKRAVQELVKRWLEDNESGATHSSSREPSAARIKDAWRRAMIEVQGRTRRSSSADDAAGDAVEVSITALAEEMATYRRCLPELLREHEGEFVLIKGSEIIGIFPDRSAGLREGYRRFGVIPLLVRQITTSDPAVYIPNVVL